MKRQIINPHLFKVPKVKILKGRIEFVLQKCKGKKVLHLGCVDEGLTMERIRNGTLMHLQLTKIAKEVWGVDKSERGIKLLQNEGISNLILGDVEHLDSIKELREENFDIILASEIIEHLNNPGLFLRSAKTLFSPNTEMILTTPNAFRFAEVSYNLKGYEFVHPDHNYWFSWKTLSTLLTKNGYVINEILAYSFIDHKTPIFKKVAKKILGRGKGYNNGKVIQRGTFKRTSLIGLSNKIKAMTNILIRRYLYSKNSFFADGLIFVVKPKGFEIR